MKKPWWIAAGTIALCATAAAAYLLTQNRREWSTDSPAALAAYLEGREAALKIYTADAARAYQRALELDPGFVAPQVGLVDASPNPEVRKERVDALRRVDRSRLTERERLMLEATILAFDGERDRRRELIEAYLAEHREDPIALAMAANDDWLKQDWQAAKRGFEHLLEIDPSWVMARNTLGYIAMGQGNFAEAEEQFRIYRYVAPDQANPHDSLGELLVLMGRYDEARRELEQALAIRPDFCASYQNLVNVAIFDRRAEDLPGIAERVARHCDGKLAARARCTALLGGALLEGDFERPWSDAGRAACDEATEDPDILRHLLAMLTGRREVARALEAKLSAEIAEADARGQRSAQESQGLRNLLGLLEGQRLLFEGRAAAAAERLRDVDEVISHWAGNGGGVARLLTQLQLAEALEASGDHAGAQKTLARVREVNPSFAAWFDIGPWRRVAPARASAAVDRAAR